MVTRSMPATLLRPVSAAEAHERIALWISGLITAEPTAAFPVLPSICRRVSLVVLESLFTGSTSMNGILPHGDGDRK
jgi:hypothetical protein